MYKELEQDIEGFKRPNHGCLVGWSKQGVLLLNACLTVRQAQANSHKDQVTNFCHGLFKRVSGFPIFAGCRTPDIKSFQSQPYNVHRTCKANKI